MRRAGLPGPAALPRVVRVMEGRKKDLRGAPPARRSLARVPASVA
jgi:hypothetical protein